MAGIFSCSALTEKGLALSAKVQSGLSSIAFTKAAAGDGAYSDDEDISQRTSLKQQRQTFPITSVGVRSPSSVAVRFIASNHQSQEHGGDLVRGYEIREIGIFARDPDEGEILYAIALGVEDHYDYMPAYDEQIPTEIAINYIAALANADSVTLEMPSGAFVLYDDATGERYILGIANGELYYRKEGDS